MNKKPASTHEQTAQHALRRRIIKAATHINVNPGVVQLTVRLLVDGKIGGTAFQYHRGAANSGRPSGAIFDSRSAMKAGVMASA